MRQPNKQFSKLILVCTNCRDDGRECCAEKGSVELHHQLKMACAQYDPTIRVSKSGCLGNCASGGSVVIMPDNIYLGEVKVKDIPEIMNMIKFGKNNQEI